MVRAEVVKALHDLDNKTPAFFVAEIWAHGDLKPRMEAKRELTELNPNRKSCKVLICMLRMSPS